MKRPAPAGLAARDAAPASTPGVPAFRYVAGKVGARNGRIIGMQMATESFFEAFIRRIAPSVLTIYGQRPDDFTEAITHVAELGFDAGQVRRLKLEEEAALAVCGSILMNDPGMLLEGAGRKNPRAFSLIGMTHSLSSYRSWREIFSYGAAPLQPWDALVCTSTAARNVVDALMDNADEELRAAGHAGPAPRPALPIIPLGIDAVGLAPDASARARWRTRLGMRDDDVVVLFVGRLSFHAKAHPVAMFRSVAAAARDLPDGKRLRLALLGAAHNESIDKVFREAAAAHAPGVTVDFLAGPTAADRSEALSGADLFISLADSVQETFGLSPVEAMAAGLPVVVTDWNGYRDTVRHEVDGFRVPTVMAPPAAFTPSMLNDFADQKLTYDRFCALMGQLVAVDERATAAAIRTLAVDAGRRRSMGQAAMQGARDRFDWAAVMEAHRLLWRDLAEVRQRAPIASPVAALRKLKPTINPLVLFGRFPTAILAQTDRLTIADPDVVAARAAISRLEAEPTFNHVLSIVSSQPELLAAFDRIAEKPGTTVDELVRAVPLDRRRRLVRGLLLLAKRGLIEWRARVERPMA